MASGVEELLGMLYDMIEDGKPVPMHAEQCKIDRDRALDLLDEIRAQFPVELGEARKLLAAKEDFISDARSEADEIRKEAQEQVKQMVTDTEVARQAKEAANAIVKKAQDQARDIRHAANEYCDEVLKSAEVSMNKAAAELKQAQSGFRQLSSSFEEGSSAKSAPYIPEI